MVVAVMFSHAEKKGIEANRRPAKNYYRDAFMATSGNLLGTFRNMTSALYNLWLITFREPSGYLPGASGTRSLYILEGKNQTEK